MIPGPWPTRGINVIAGRRALLRDHPKIRRRLAPVYCDVTGFTWTPPPHGWPELKWLAMLLWRQARTRRKPNATA